MLACLGYDPRDAAIADTPARWAKWWVEFLAHDPGTVSTAFDAVTTDQMVVLTGVRVWSLCEHHLLPFYSDLAMAYIARDRVLGISKLARVAQRHAHRLQLQERLTHGIASEIQGLTGSPDVAVVARGEHLCMEMRGVKTDGLMTSSALSGAFRDDARARAEFFAHLAAADQRRR